MFERLLTEAGLSVGKLVAFVRFAEAGSIRAAARGNTVRQTQYSRQIKELSEFFGVELVRRKGRGLELTQRGRELARAARAHLKVLDDIKASCGAEPVEYRLGAANSVLQRLVLPRFGRLLSGASKAAWHFHNMSAESVVAGIDDHVLDFGVVRRSAIGERAASQKLRTVGYSVFLPKRLCRSGERPEKAALRIPLATSNGTEFLEELTAALDRRGVRLDLRCFCNSFSQAACILRSGAAGAILPDYFAEGFGPDVSEVPLPALDLGAYRRDIVLVWHRRLFLLRPAAKAVKEDLVKILGRGSDGFVRRAPMHGGLAAPQRT